MQNISIRIVLAIMVLLVVSCSEPRGTYLGYSRPVDLSGGGSFSRTNLKDDLYESLGAKGSGLTLRELYPAEYEAMSYYPKFPPANSAKMMAHGHSRVEYYENAVFCQEGYVSECDIARLQTVLEKVASNKLGSMLALMNRSSFEYHRFSHVFMPLLSKAIIDKINSVERIDPYTDLGGWQMFKPTKGLDEEAAKYAVMASDDGWFDIVSADNTNVVSVKVMYGGKYLNPIIVGVKNKALSIDICDTNYDHSADKKMLACTPYDDEYMFLKFLGPILYKESGTRTFVTEADFEHFTTKVNERKMAFVHQFYSNVLASNDNLKKIHKTYFYSLPQHLVAMADSQIAKKNYSTEMFLPCSYGEFAKSGFSVTYLGKDWYQVTAPKSGGKSLRLKVVLYGPKLRPAIMGVRNPNHNVDYCPRRFE